MKKSDVNEIIERLEEIRKYATMETAKFSTWNTTPRVDMTNETLTKIVRSSTALWRGSYILNPLGEIIEKLKAEIS